MKRYQKRSEIFIAVTIPLMVIILAMSSYAENNSIRAKLVKNKSVSEALIKETACVAPPDSEIEEGQIVEVLLQNRVTYIVPVKSNVGDSRNCSIYSFNQSKKLKQKLILSELEELESCEIIKAVFSCNSQENRGIGVLYSKRLGADNYWFEGSFFNVDSKNSLTENKALSKKLNDTETVENAKKKLGCR